MVILQLFEFVLVFFGILFIVTQMIIPAIRGTASFPMFHKEQKLVNELVDVNQQQREQALEAALKAEKEKLNNNA